MTLPPIAGLRQEQLDLGAKIDTDLQLVVQLHWQEQHNVNRVSALPAPV